MKTRKPMWEIKQKADAPGVLDLYIYGDVDGDWYNFWDDEVIESVTSANTLREKLAEYPNATQINLYINSWGGSVFEGTAIYNQLRRHPAHKTVYIDGFACSIASVIAMAGDEIVMPRNALMMIHNMWMRVEGNAEELRKAADDLEKMNLAGREAYLQKAGDKLTPEALAQMADAETWLTAEECIQYGLADRYAEEPADMSQAASVLKDMEQRLKMQTAIAAKLRQMVQTQDTKEHREAEEPPEPVPSPEEPEEKKETNPIFELFKGGIER